MSNQKKILVIIGLSFVSILIYGYITKQLSEWQFYVQDHVKKVWLEIVVFMTTMTYRKAIFLGIKRWIIDHIISKNLKDHFFVHFSDPVNLWWFSLSAKQKAKMFLPASVVAVGSVFIAGLANITAFAAIKALIIGFFKGLWLFIAWIGKSFITKLWTPWIIPLLELFAFSWIIDQLNKIPVVREKIIPWFNKTFYPWFRKNILMKFEFLIDFFSRLGLGLDLYVQTPVSRGMNKSGQSLSNKMSKKIITYMPETKERAVFKKKFCK